MGFEEHGGELSADQIEVLGCIGMGVVDDGVVAFAVVALGLTDSRDGLVRSEDPSGVDNEGVSKRRGSYFDEKSLAVCKAYREGLKGLTLASCTGLSNQ